jgi:molecular chaperone DnaK
MQGDSDNAEENEFLGEFVMTGLRRAPKGEVEIEVTFEINTDGIVAVKAKDLETGQAQSIEVTASSGLTEDEIKNMVKNAEGYMVERRTDEEFEGAKQRAETLIDGIESLLPDVERVVGTADFGRDAISKARTVLEQTKSAIERKNTDQVKGQVELLERTERMFKGVVSRAQ